MALNYSSKHDISYANYNNKNIPWQLNASIISQNNQTINPSLNLGAINNNLVIESSQNDILFIISQNSNKKVIVKNNMAINSNLDVSNSLKTKLIDASSISLNNILYFPSLPINIIGDLKVDGAITVIGSSSTGLQESKTQFINSTLRTSKFTDVSIVECDISDSSFNNVNIINSYINAIPNGYGFDKSNNSYPNKANFSDVSLQRLVLDSSLNSYINFAANANSDNSIIIRSYDDYSKLVINKPLNIEIGETISNISNVSIFYGTISCDTLYYSQLVPDIRLNTYFDVSIGLVSISGNNIPVNNSFNIGSSNYKFNTIISTQFIGDLNGTASSANDLKKNLDMSFNNLDIYGTFTLNRKNLNQFLSGDLISIVAADISFIAANNRVRDLSRLLYSQQGFDLCLNSNFTKISLRDTSFDALNNKITSISASVYSKSDFDLCLNRNYIRNNDVSAIASIVSNPPLIYPGLFYLNSSLNKVTDAKVANELVFPYAITYVDDAYEDNFLKEDYSYQISVFINTTTTYVRPANAQPDDLNAKSAVIRYVNSTDPTYKNTWNDVGENELLPAVYKINGTSVTNVVTTYSFNTAELTWQQHQDNAVSIGRNLAVILNSTQQQDARNSVPSNVGGSVYIGGYRYTNANTNTGTASEWRWITGDQWSYTNWITGEPNGGESEPHLEMWLRESGDAWNGKWNDSQGGNAIRRAIYMNRQTTTTTTPERYEVNSALMTWQQHKQEAINRGGQIAIIQDDVVNNYIGNLIAASNIAFTYKDLRGVYINLRRTTNGTDRYGVTTADWEWDSGEPWYGYHKFYQGGVLIPEYTNNYRTDSYNSSNPKLPIIVASSNGSVVATGTSVQSGPNNAINNTASNAGYLKISENNINNSYYRTINTQTLHADTCSLAMSNDGMFIAYIQGSSSGYPVLKVNMRNSDGWGQQLGTTILLTDSYDNYQTMASGIIPTIFGNDWKKNIQNLAINYISGENPPRIFLAFGSARSKVSIYSYDNANWIFSNGFYSVTGGSWVLKHTHLASTLGASTNFGYFVVLSHNPRILVFTIDDRFYTYNCSDSSFAARGSNAFIRLPTGVTNFTNIIALKITSDADKIIVSNTHYVYIYKWNNASWTSIRVLDFNVTFNYGSTNNIPAGPRSLDISNINTNNNDCVFAIGFPDKLINSRANNRSRGYVEYYQCLTSSPSAIITKLATLVPRKRDINNNNVDTNEYFFSAGGIKITNANTILVSPNFKFHFNNTTKNYEYNSSTQSWTAHNTNATSVTGRTMASIENEVENELVKITARNNQLWLGGMRRSSSITASGRTSIDWEWSSADSSWNYVNWGINEPNNVSEKRLHLLYNGTWNDLTENVLLPAMYMTRSLSYSLNNFNVFDRFYFHSSGFFSSYFPTDVSNRVIARWATTDTPLNRSIEIRANGQMFSRSYGSISDIRLKENIVDASPKLEDLLKVRVVNYNLKGSKDAKLIGVVAQELEKLFPTLVKDGELSQHDIYLGKTESYKSVKYSCFDVMLIKAFQEQMAIINTLSSQLDEQEKKCKLLKIISQDCVILKQELDLLKRENELFKLNINEILKLI